MSSAVQRNAQRYVKRPFVTLPTGDDTPRLTHAGRVLSDPSHQQPRVMHAHQGLVEIILIDAGEGVFLLDDRKRRVQAGDLLIYNAGMVHDETVPPESGASWWCVGVSGIRMPGLRPDALVPDGHECVFPTGERFDDLRELFAMVHRSLSRGLPDAERLCHYLMLSILSETLTILSGAQAPPLTASDALARRIKSYIDAHFAEPLSLPDLASALHVSPWYLSHVFKKEIGYSPMRYLARRRIGEAQTLLLETDLPVGRIAEQVGYETQTYFNQQFTKNVGVPPGQYRRESLAAESVPAQEDGPSTRNDGIPQKDAARKKDPDKKKKDRPT